MRDWNGLLRWRRGKCLHIGCVGCQKRSTREYVSVILWVSSLLVLHMTYHDEASDSNRDDDHVEDASLASAISDVSNNDCHSRCDSVRWNRQELSFCTGVAHASKNGGQEEGESIEWHQTSHVDDGVSPALPVLDGSGDVAAVVLLGRVGLVVRSEAATHADAVLRRQEASSTGPIEDHPPAEAANEHSSETL